jgi:hypothetical protein
MKRPAMKRTLLTLTLVLAASVPAFAQQAGGLERRNGDVFVGPVRTARAETASYVKRDGELVEGPRKLAFAVSYSEDGKRRDWEDYAPDGTPRRRNVIVYDDAGRMVEQNYYSGHDQLVARIVRKPNEGEKLVYDGNGRARRTVIVKREDGSMEARVYNADGTLDRTSVMKRDDDAFTTKSNDGNGMLLGESDARVGAGGSHVNEDQHYDAIGAPANRRVTTVSPGANKFESVVVKPDGTQLRMRETRERDARGNPVKSVRYVWDEAAGDFVPTAVTYYTVTYYR